jgi:nucleotide-binding universal stress UspA family protein
MSVVVGYLAGKSGNAPLRLAVEVSRSLELPLTVATVVPKPWTRPSPARIDAEYADWASKLAHDSGVEARRALAEIADGIDVSFHPVAHRSVPGGLLDVVEQLHADFLVLGSAADGHLGQVVVGSTGDRLLHSSPVPLAISPRGYRGSAKRCVNRISVGYPATTEGVGVVKQVAALTSKLKIPMRVVTFAVRGRTMYPPESGLHVEDSILSEWAGEARKALAQLRADGIVVGSAEMLVLTGNGWDQAMDAGEWIDGEMLALGTAERQGLTKVFLGSRAGKILRHSPVPVVVFPS